MPQSPSEDIRHTGDGDHLSIVYIAGGTQGLAFHNELFSGSLVLCLIARLTRQIKQHFLLIGDLILYVTFLNSRFVSGLFVQEVECFSCRGECRYQASICLVTDRHPLWALPHQSQPIPKVIFPVTFVCVTSCQSTLPLNRCSIA